MGNIGKWIVDNWATISSVLAALGTGAGVLWKKVIYPRWRAARLTYAETVKGIKDLTAQVELVKKQVLPNGGNSLADVLQTIRRQQEFHHQVILTLHDLQGQPFWYSDERGSCMVASDELKRIVGNEALGNAWLSGLHPDDVEAVRRAWQLSVKDLRPFRMTYRFLHDDSQVFWVEGKGQPLKHWQEDAQLPCFVGVLRVLTEAEGAQRIARRSNRKERDTDP